jgi:hypothetical protein
VSITLVFYPGVVRSTVAPIDNGISPISTVQVFAFAVSDRISVTQVSNWDIKGQGISKQQQVAFDTLRRVHITGWLESNSPVRPIVWPIDTRNFVPSLSFDVYRRTSATKAFAFKVLQRKSAKHTEYFNVRNYMFSNAKVVFNTRSRVYKPGVTVGGWTNQINEPITKPIATSNSTPSYLFTWDSQKIIFPQKMIRFNSRGRLSVTQQIQYNDYGTLVRCQRQILWNVLERI